MCEIGAIMEKDEQYCRGWIRLYEQEANHEMLIEMAQYKLGISRLIKAHIDRCVTCQQHEDRKARALEARTA